MLLKRKIGFRRHHVAHAEIISCGNIVLISRKGTRGQFLRLSGEKPQHNGGIQSECHGSSSVMADYALADGSHIMRKIRIDLDAPKP